MTLPAGSPGAPGAPGAGGDWANSFPMQLPFTDAQRKPKTIAEFIARVNKERGGFRNLTSAGLLEEIRQRDEKEAAAAAAKDDNDGGDTEMCEGEGENEDEDEGEDVESTTIGGDDDIGGGEIDVYEAKAKILQGLDVARNTSLMLLDLVSLLLSKESPALAAQTLSPMLRDLVGIGTLGAGKLSLPSDASNGYLTHPNPARVNNPAKAADEEAVAVGWTILDTHATRAAASSAAKKLAKEAALEARYWADVMKLRDAGWTVSRLPGPQKLLGVQLGFREGAAEHRESSAVALRRDEDAGGAVSMHRDAMGRDSQRLVVTVERNGKITARSGAAASPLPVDVPLGARVLEARNTAFAYELWHELHREYRQLFPLGVKRDGTKISCTLDDRATIHVDLETVGDAESEDGAETSSAAADSSMAEAIHLSLHTLLSHAHRNDETRRLKPRPPHIRRSDPDRPAYHLFQPILQHILHHAHTAQLLEFIGELVATLHTAGMPHAVFTVSSPPPVLIPDLLSAAVAEQQHTTTSQAIVHQLLAPRQLRVHLTITPSAQFVVESRTTLDPLITTSIALPPPGAESPTTNWLMESCPPYPEGYLNMRTLRRFLCLAAQRALVDHYLANMAGFGADPGSSWLPGMSRTSLVEFVYHARSGRAVPNREISLRVLHDDDEDDTNEDGSRSRPSDVDSSSSNRQANIRLVVMAVSKHGRGGVDKIRRFWTAKGASSPQTLDAVMREACALPPPAPPA